MAVRVGIIGCGAIGQRRHIPEAAAHPDVEIVALCDINKNRLEEIGKKYNVEALFTDYKSMLKGAELDALVVGTPNAFHAEQAVAGSNAGCHVLVEKPIAASLKEATAMIKAADKAGKYLMVGQNQRLMPPHVKAREILASGVLGRVIAFQTTFKHPGPDQWSVDGAKSWFFDKAKAVMGVCGDLGVHKIDLMRYLIGQEIVEVSGFVGTLDKTYPNSKKKIDVDDNAFLSVKTDKGVLGTINISWTNYGHFEDNGTIIYCEKGVLAIGTDPQFGVVVHYSDNTKQMHKLGAVSTNTRQVGSGIMEMFIGAILQGKPPSIDGNEGYKSLAVILAAMEASKSGKTITIR